MSFFRKKFGGKSSKKKSPDSTSGRFPPSPSPTDLTNGDMGEPSDVLKPNSSWENKSKHLLGRSASLQDFDTGDLALNSVDIPESALRTKSRLSKAFGEMLNDKDALPYFIQFMDAKKSPHLIKFWLESESFQASTWSRIRSHSLHSMSKSSLQGTTTEPSPAETMIETAAIKSDSPPPDNIISSGVGVEPRTNERAAAAVLCNNTNVILANCHHRPSADFVIDEAEEISVRSPSSENETGMTTGTIHLDIENEDHLGEKLRKGIEHDAIAIYSKYISLDATHPIDISEELRNATISKICREDGQVDPHSFVDCQNVVLDIMDKNYYPEYMESEYHCKYQIDVLTSGTVYLADVLYNDAAMFYFMEFMEVEGAMALLEFLMAVDNFQQHLLSLQGNYDGIQAQDDAMIVYDKYFSLQASTPLGVNDSTRFEIESNICRDGGPLPDCFDVAKNIVLRHIDKHYFKTYLRSELFYKYLNELILTVQSKDVASTPLLQKRRGSDASSEVSVGAQSNTSGNIEPVSYWNTLLAGTDSNQAQIRKVLKRLTYDLRIDTRCFNPDTLWERENSGKITLGKVDQYGQFTSEFDHEPDHDKKANGLFSNKKKKDKEKAQEDMAWQIAQMIVRDVTSVSSQSYEGDEDS
ncbi:A-kinase anchor protein 10, mitochondrial-like [Tubulanus polymorphus]|uniref:A-kinase anchor protein 10, mitochondrial-like n=1 Tax=Tubulanus polymorphus TaxID=672921 RepID=UPI003DA1D595